MIKLKDVSKSFGNRHIFENFDLEITPRKITAIVGKSGTGKTTLLNLIGLLDTEYEGEIIVNDTNLKILKPKQRAKFIRENINYLFQDYALIEMENVEYNLLLSLAYVKISSSEKIKLINEALEKVGLSEFNKKPVYTLSGGEQQRVALARTIIKPGNIVLTDEPTGNLDEYNGNIVFDLLEQLKEQNKTVIIVTHNLELAKKCDYLVEL